MADITTDGNDVLTGGSGVDTINGGGGSDIINSGAGSDIIDGGSGSDRLNGGSGSDTLIYTLAENYGATDVYTGGSGTDTIQLRFTLAEWLTPSVQTQLATYLQHLVTYTNAKTLEVSNGIKGIGNYKSTFLGRIVMSHQFNSSDRSNRCSSSFFSLPQSFTPFS